MESSSSLLLVLNKCKMKWLSGIQQQLQDEMASMKDTIQQQLVSNTKQLQEEMSAVQAGI